MDKDLERSDELDLWSPLEKVPLAAARSHKAFGAIDLPSKGR